LHAPSWQAPALQTPVALANVQAVVQLPQCAASVFRFASQPFATLESQLPKPALHVMLQVLALQDAVPFTLLQAFPQAPQLLRLLLRFTSQPSVYCPLQFAYGAVHALIEQVVPTQLGVPWATAQIVPQPPQALTLFVVAVSQPFAALASQSP
jgi:hypothetical protein